MILSAFVFVFIGSTLFISPRTARADMATDDLKILVGYYGMELDDYFEVADYYWWDMEDNMSVCEQEYSFFTGSGQANDGGNGYDGYEYNEIVSCGRGVLISDLLEYAGIYYDHVESLLFYVEDTQGIWTSFDRESLFKERYYFSNLAGYREPIYREILGTTDYTIIDGWDFSDAWEGAQPVEPMIAFESNWVSYNQNFESNKADWSYLETSTRFRLLYGQVCPTETMTRESAKFVSRIYVTLDSTAAGTPTIGEMPEEITGQIGSAGSFDMEVDGVYNEAVLNELISKLNITDANGVLEIESVEAVRDEVYSDRVKLKINYRIVGEGKVSLQLGVGGSVLIDQSEDPETEGGITVTPETESIESQEKESTEDKSNQTESTGSESSGGNNTSQGSGNTPAADPEASGEDETEASQPAGPEAESSAEPEEIDGSSSVFVLSEDAARLLEELIDSGQIITDEDVEELVVEDTTIIDEEELRQITLWVCVGVALLCIIGFAIGILSYRFRLKWSVRDLAQGAAGKVSRFILGEYFDEKGKDK